MTDLIIDVDGYDSIPSNSVRNAESTIINMINEGTSPCDITVSIVVREKLQFEVTSICIARSNGQEVT